MRADPVISRGAEHTALNRRGAWISWAVLAPAILATASPAYSTITGNGRDVVPYCPERSQAETTAAAALVIGIDDYTNASKGAAASTGGRVWRNLKGSVNDARAMADLLVHRFGLACDSVLVLLDKDATGDRIRSGFSEFLSSRAGPDTRLYVYYAGHGSQAPNPLTDEQDGKDETIVPWDSAAGAADISDKQIARYLNDLLLNHKSQVTAIFDSCHSGSISRDPGGAGIHRQLGESSIPVSLKPDERGDPWRNGAIILDAADEQQLAREITDADGRHWGAFSHALIHLLWGAAADMSLDELSISINARMRAAGTEQRASVKSPEGPRARPLIPGAKALTGSRAVAAVAAIEAPDRIQLLGGIDAGLWPKAEVEIAGSGRWCVESANLGPARVRARPCPDADATGPEVGALARLTRAGIPPVPPLRVLVPETLPSHTDATLLNDVVEQLSKIDAVQISREPDASSHYRLAAGADGRLFWERAIESPVVMPARLPPVKPGETRSAADLVAQIGGLTNRHTWQSFGPEPSSAFPMRFELRDTATGEPIANGGTVPLNANLQLFAVPTRTFTASDLNLGDAQRRHVYAWAYGEQSGGAIVAPTGDKATDVLPLSGSEGDQSEGHSLANITRVNPSQRVRLVILTSTRPLNRDTLRAQVLEGVRGSASQSGLPFDELRGPDTRESNRGESARAALWDVQYVDFVVAPDGAPK